MFLRYSWAALVAALISASPAEAFLFAKRQDITLPADITDYKTITSPTGVNIRYLEPGKSGVCETTPGVNSFVSLQPLC